MSTPSFGKRKLSAFDDDSQEVQLPSNSVIRRRASEPMIPELKFPMGWNSTYGSEYSSANGTPSTAISPALTALTLESPGTPGSAHHMGHMPRRLSQPLLPSELAHLSHRGLETRSYTNALLQPDFMMRISEVPLHPDEDTLAEESFFVPNFHSEQMHAPYDPIFATSSAYDAPIFHMESSESFDHSPTSIIPPINGFSTIPPSMDSNSFVSTIHVHQPPLQPAVRYIETTSSSEGSPSLENFQDDPAPLSPMSSQPMSPAHAVQASKHQSNNSTTSAVPSTSVSTSAPSGPRLRSTSSAEDIEADFLAAVEGPAVDHVKKRRRQASELAESERWSVPLFDFFWGGGHNLTLITNLHTGIAKMDAASSIEYHRPFRFVVIELRVL